VSGSGWGCREDERRALLLINASLTIPIYSAEGEWRGKECCRWERVTCDPTTGHITELDLGIDPSLYADADLLQNATIFVPLLQLKSLSLSGHQIPGFLAGAGMHVS
jgi:Leucine rich repeat N-terminal domain